MESNNTPVPAVAPNEAEAAKEPESLAPEASESGGLRRNHKRQAKTEGREAMKVPYFFPLLLVAAEQRW